MHLPPLIADLAVILGVAAIVTFLFRLIRQPVVLGYIVAGIIVGPYTPTGFTIFDKQNVTDWAELGVIFLMFSLGLEFSFRRLARVGMSAGVTASLQIGTMIVLGLLSARALGWTGMEGTFLGCMLAISSTTIIIKALEELGLKKRRFAELVFGMLIVEDLAAIIMLVALTNIATQATVSGTDLLIAGAKLGFVVAVWFIVGMFVVPKFVRAVGKRGTDEMLTVVSLGLCLGLVYLSAYFHYSVALGAFIMGSILAETKEVHRIETLTAPLKDIFGAVFFVSVGMLLDPQIIMTNLGPIALLCVVIILGKVGSVTIGALMTGQTLTTAAYSGMSMAQIGEFSFIIASLGLTYKVISPTLYPIIVAASLITTFTTPYLIRYAPWVIQFLEKRLPQTIQTKLARYNTWFQNRSNGNGKGFEKTFYVRLMRWVANAVVVVTIFLISSDQLIPILQEQIEGTRNAKAFAWLITFFACTPFIWGMLTSFRPPLEERLNKKGKRDYSKDLGFLLSRFITILMVGLLSIAFFPAWLAVLLTLGVSVVLFLTLKAQIENYYHWFEKQFVSGFAPGQSEGKEHAHLVPWNAYLADIKVNDTSSVVGKSLIELQIRERFGVNVVVIKRPDENVVAPQANEKIFPSDILSCFGTEEEIERFRTEVENPRPASQRPSDLTAYALRQMAITQKSTLSGRSIKSSGIRETFDCMVVGVERGSSRIQNPKSDLILNHGDQLWIVGQKANLEQLVQHM